MQVSQAPLFAGLPVRKPASRGGFLKTAAMAAALMVPLAGTTVQAADRVDFSILKTASPSRLQEGPAMQDEALELGRQVQNLNRNFQATLFDIYRNRAQYGDAEFQAETERILPEMLAEHAAMGVRMQFRELRFQEQLKTARNNEEARALVRAYMDEVGNRFFGPVETTVSQVHRFSVQRNMTALVERLQPLKAEVDQTREKLAQFESEFGRD